MAAPYSLVMPIGAGNWPVAAALTNLRAGERNRYSTKLAFMNAIEAINLSLPNYTDAAHPFSNAGGRAAQALAAFNSQYAVTLGRAPYSTVHSLRSAWSHDKKKMMDLIDRHSGLVGPALLPAAPGPVVVGQPPAPPARTPLPSSRPNSMVDAMMAEREDEDEDESEEDDELVWTWGSGGN